MKIEFNITSDEYASFLFLFILVFFAFIILN